MCDPRAILSEVLESYADAEKWVDSTFEKAKRISNSKVGEMGQDFAEKLCEALGFAQERSPSKQWPWDIRIEGVTFEVKTATEDTRRAFQFNHIRHHRDYQGLLCIGIAPEDILFHAWSKADVATKKAGHLVTMDKGSSATWKLTKKRDDLLPISTFESHILGLVVELTNGGS